MKSATISDGKPENYVVCEIEILSGHLKMAQTKVKDASHHEDSKALRKVIFDAIDKNFSDLPVQRKMEYAPLFLPGLNAEEMREVLSSSPAMQALDAVIRANSKL